MDNENTLVVTADYNNIKSFEGLSSDLTNLPTTGIETGSTFFAIDTGKAYKFEKTTAQWYEL